MRETIVKKLIKMIKTSEEICRDCEYSKIALFATKYYYCDYFLMTSNHRNCKVGECDKFKKRKKLRGNMKKNE